MPSGSGSRPIDIAFWEFLVVLVYMVLVGVVFSRKKAINIKQHPEYKYYLWGIYSKIIGGVLFSLTYVYYYDNGDTISYFRSAVPLANLALKDPVMFFQALFADNTPENRYLFFDQETGYPIPYVYYDSRTYWLVRLISPLVLFSFKSYLLATAFVSTIAFGGVWSLYRTFVRYYPTLRWQLALAILFFPSTLFWGSGIMKDTFTFTALCLYISSLDAFFFLKRDRLRAGSIGLVASALMIAMKPYIFMMIFPAGLLWAMHRRVSRIRNSLVRVLFLPMAMAALGFLVIVTLESLGDRLNKFSLDKALETIVVSQNDLKRGEQYGDNYFDLGELEPTWSSVFSKLHVATFAGLFRPTILEAKNVVVMLAALENAWLLVFSITILIRSRLVHLITLIRSNPLLQMCFLFSLGYAFMIGVTTPNFGAMIRFKIALLPLYVSALFITDLILKRWRAASNRGLGFQFKTFVDGDPERAT
ncbi:MAG: hypothetical protein R2815_13525 [Flavobacteriales bacterium]|nr:hypothetical protein [Flavobacteriales bacterium]